MKYRHAFHAGNFADVHKHVTLLALLAALKRKDKGFLYLDTHAGRGRYDLSGTAESAAGVGRLLGREHRAAELADFIAALGRFRAAGGGHFYPGSPLLAALELRTQDRGVFAERQGLEARALGAALAALPSGTGAARLRIERGDGLAVLRAALPPRERRALVLIDPPYEDPQVEFTAVAGAVAAGLRRFATGVFAVWYPIKEQRLAEAWHVEWARTVAAPTLLSELWLYPRDSRVALNGSGLLIVNPPWQTLERMRIWLPELAAGLAVGDSGGAEVRML
jgi:23S rRNA (adenine2030-N6)-methyltransferase